MTNMELNNRCLLACRLFIARVEARRTMGVVTPQYYFDALAKLESRQHIKEGRLMNWLKDKADRYKMFVDEGTDFFADEYGFTCYGGFWGGIQANWKPDAVRDATGIELMKWKQYLDGEITFSQLQQSLSVAYCPEEWKKIYDFNRTRRSKARR